MLSARFAARARAALAVSALAVSALAVLALAAACHGRDSHAVSTGAASEPTRDTTLLSMQAPGSPGRRGRLSPLADTLAQRITFAPASQQWFLAAARGKRLLVDVGRVDAELKKDTTRIAAVREATARMSPLPLGARVRVFGPWGTDGGTVAGFDVWNGRVVATLSVSPRVDSLAQHVDPLAVAVRRVDSAAPATTDSCHRDVVPPALAERASFVRDSMEMRLREEASPPFERLRKSLVVRSARIPGCFALGRVVVVVSVRAGGTEYVVERYAIVGDGGEVTPIRANDYRLKAHDVLYALDADGDGVDDLASRGLGDGSGALTIMRLDPKARRLERWVSGFSWESR